MFGVIIRPSPNPVQNEAGKTQSLDLIRLNTVFFCGKCGELESMYDGIIVEGKWICEDECCLQVKTKKKK